MSEERISELEARVRALEDQVRELREFAEALRQWAVSGVANNPQGEPCNPNHRLLSSSPPPVQKPGEPGDGTKAALLLSLLKDGQWHTAQECYDYVKARSSLDITPARFGQRRLNRYYEVCITDDDMVRLGKPRP